MRQRSKLKRYEYQEIYEKYEEKAWSIRKISRYLGRAPSTISRLLRRDKHPCPGIWNKMISYEKAMYAWEKSRKRASECRQRPRLKTDRILRLVVFLLSSWHWSPETISDFLKAHGLKISAKAIYNFIRNERPWLKAYLRQRGKKRRQRVAHPRSVFRAGVPEKKSIHDRPPIIEPGHWEIDTILSKKGTKGGVLTIRELSSRKRFYSLIADLKAETVIRILLPFFQALPTHMRKTLTADNGSENAELYKLEKVMPEMKVYYCDPYKAWQRGSVENANGELRWYFPKKTDFSIVTKRQLEKTQYKINNKPMKVNGGRAASAMFKLYLNAA